MGRLALVALAVFATACRPAPEVDDAPFDDSEVITVLEGYLGAIAARDSAAIRAAIVDDGRFAWLEDGQLRYWSVDALLQSLLAFGANTPLRTRTEQLTVVPVGRDGARAWAGFTTRVGEGEGAYTFGGILSWTLERREGAWRIVGGHTSSRRTPAPSG